ncbi:amidase family protein [Sphingomonas sp.]|uniref:amidase family protein n=1 Tax=Sphingomonas sp. TaxID=28214 RepID=UPI002D8028D7|nr:amidase family protein [Sphingomonas sp.]HEU0044611.1 amidase family protein [Sphingomonas sp.]
MNSALATAAAIRAGETTALAECEAAIARIEARDGEINAVVVRDFDRARAAARTFDAAGDKSLPFAGVPMTVKESFDVAGLPTSWGFAEHADHIAGEDANAVQRLKAAGAIILGKTNTPVGLADLQSVNPNYGRTRNPRDGDRVSGGSSGGSAASLAAGYVPIELGSDIGGSIRVPAAFCGVWGLKPTFTALNPDGHYFPRTDNARLALSVIGPMARDAADLDVMLSVLAEIPLPRANDKPVGQLRLLVLNGHPMAKVQRAIVGAIDILAEALRAAGAAVDRTSDLIPNLEKQHRAYWRMLSVGMSRGVPVDGGERASLSEWFELSDEQARNTRQWARLFAHYDAVIAPALGSTAFRHDDTPLAERTLDIDGEATPFIHQFVFPGLATFPMLPAVSMPIGSDGDGLPIGVQVITALNHDHDAIRIAAIAHDLVWSI